MHFAVITATLFGVVGVSAVPLDAPELVIRAPAAVITKCTQPRTVALTYVFDDGPYVNTRKLVDLLDSNGAKGTWFVNDGCIYDSSNAGAVKYVFDKGHQVLCTELFRPPYGEYDDEVREVAGSLGQKGSSASSRRMRWMKASQSKNDYKNLVSKNPNNVLTLNHETYAKGYKMVTVAQCLGQSPYKSTGSPSPRDSKDTPL
ncbi:polysaccharide deacetylase domain-containing protein [Rhizoctonia solani AG-1 IA]|uniref:Polysaccharide deacetylase domain-containing protein n=1 Tax=Thanatephorus cucumeris (strain AG1-IA) TaxID=983506 RepID=L8XAV3_THACA|nr:polysaccharide deacetylase domain-containing protein [Rhizoctonia solani AG-1 IA]